MWRNLAFNLFGNLGWAVSFPTLTVLGLIPLFLYRGLMSRASMQAPVPETALA